MSGFFTFIYIGISIMISYKMGFNWLSGSLLLGSVCALFGGSGARGMWHSGNKLVGSILGVIVTGAGIYAVQSSGVVLHFGDIRITADIWVIVGAITFFLITTKADSQEASVIAPTPKVKNNLSAGEYDADKAEAVCYAYLKIWRELELVPTQVYDEAKLPCDKDSLLTILKHWLSTATDPIIKENWGIIFVDISSFQPNIGETPLGLDFNSLPKTDDVEAIAKAVLSAQIPSEIEDKVNSERMELEEWYSKNVFQSN